MQVKLNGEDLLVIWFASALALSCLILGVFVG